MGSISTIEEIKNEVHEIMKSSDMVLPFHSAAVLLLIQRLEVMYSQLRDMEDLMR